MSSLRAYLALLLLASIGCAHHQIAKATPLPTCVGAFGTDHSALNAAPALVAQAVSGVRLRGEQDEMLRLEAKLPGFGGWYRDSSALVVYMKPTSGTSPSVVRETLYETYAARPDLLGRTITAEAKDAKIVFGEYSLSELIAIENRIANPRVRISGFAGVGTSIVLNRVKVGFRDTASVCPGLAAITSMGVPRAALIPEVWGTARLL
jgi:hypothetical protein